MLRIVVAGVSAWLLALALTPAMRAFATRRGWVCHPRADRWSTRTVALMGGVAIVAATLLPILLFAPGLGVREGVVLGASFLLFVVGAIDDRLQIKPHSKLLAQVLMAVAVVEAGCCFGLPEPYHLADVALTMLWLIGIGNAFNLLDNMDGLCAGIAAISAGCLAILHAGSNSLPAAVISVSLAGACLGYLRYNAHPASVFMGDCGSLFIGSLLAAAVLIHPGDGGSRSVLSVVFLPVLIMLAPVLDTVLVTVARKWHRRPVSQGGRDHSSHRLVAIGLSEPRAVRLLYALGLAGGLVALAVRWLDWYVSSLLLPVVLFGVGAVGVYLGQVRVYEDAEDLGDLLSKTPIPLVSQHRYRRRIAEVMVDTIAVAAGLYIANALRYEGSLALPEHYLAFRNALPLVVAAHLAGYFIVGVYRGVWRYTSVSDLPRFLRGATLGTVFSVVALALTHRLAGSKSLYVINWLVQFGFLAGTRISLRLLRDRLLAASDQAEQRVLVIGVSEQAELGLRCLRSDQRLELVGAVCEERSAIGLEVLDTRVLGTSRDVDRILTDSEIDRVVLTDPDYPGDAWERIAAACAAHEVPVEMVKHSVEPMEPAPVA